MPTSEAMRNLSEDIVRSYEDRIGGIAQLRETVQTLRKTASTEMKQLRSSLMAMGRKLRADLSKSSADMKAAVSTQLKELDAAHQAMARRQRADLAKGHSDLRSNVGNQLGEMHAAHQTMAKRQRADLAKGHSDLKHDVGTILKGFDAELKEVRTVLAGGRDEWQKMTATMQAKRGAPVAVAPPPPPVWEMAEEEALARAGAGEVTPGTAVIGSRVFEHLANHPDGTRLVELEQRFGVARIQVARLLKSLMNENKVEKRDLLYFAV